MMVILEQVFIHLHAMTGDQRFLFQHFPSPLFPLFLLSLNYFQFSQKQAHTKIHTNALLQVHTNKTHTSPDVSLPVPSVHPQPQLLPPRVPEGAQNASSPSGYHFPPTTARPNCICKFGLCVPLLLNPLLPSPLKRSFGCSLSVKSKWGHKVHEMKSSNAQLSCDAWAQLQKMAQANSQPKENVAEGSELFVRQLQFNK